jgi:hypothetical protein
LGGETLESSLQNSSTVFGLDPKLTFLTSLAKASVKIKLLFLVILEGITCCPFLLRGDSLAFAELKTTDKTYKNVVVSRIDNSGAHIIYESGVTTIPWSKLSKQQKTELGYDALVKAKQDEIRKETANLQLTLAAKEEAAKILWPSYKPVDSWAPISSGIMILQDGDKILLKAKITRIDDDDDYLALDLIDANGDSIQRKPDIPKGQFDSKILELYKTKAEAEFALRYVVDDRIGDYFLIDGIREPATK